MKKITPLFLICLATLFSPAQNLTAFHEPDVYVYGLKDSAGKIVVEPKYDYHEYMEYGFIKMRRDNLWTLFDSTGKAINIYGSIYDFEYVKDLKGKYARVEKDYKSGYIDTTGKEVISPLYYMGGFSEGLAHVEPSRYHFGYLDTHGKLAIDTTLNYHGVGDFSNGLAEVWISGYLYDGTDYLINDDARISGYIDKTGKEVIPLKYQSKQGFFKNGKETLSLSRNSPTAERQTYVGVKPLYHLVDTFKSENGKYGFMKKKYQEEYGMYKVTDTIAIPAKYDTVYQNVYDSLGNEYFKKGYFIVHISGKNGLVDSVGNEVTPGKYDWIDYLSLGEECIKVKLNGKTGLIGKSGKEVIAPSYYGVGNFSEGLAWVQAKQGGNFGYIDTNGKLLIDTTLKYLSAGNFSEGLAVVEGTGYTNEIGNHYQLYGYIDKTGKEIIPVKYILAEDFKKGKAKVQLSVLDKNLADHITKLYIDKNGVKVK